MTQRNMFIKRYGPPGILDTAQHGTICTIDNEYEIDIYIQVSKSEEEPKWVRMGTYKEPIDKEKIIIEASKFKNLKF